MPPAAPAASAPPQHRPCRGYSTACAQTIVSNPTRTSHGQKLRPQNRPGGKIRAKSKWNALVVVACHIIELLVVRSLVHPILGGGVLHKRQILGANEAAQPPECVVSCAATPARQPGASAGDSSLGTVTTRVLRARESLTRLLCFVCESHGFGPLGQSLRPVSAGTQPPVQIGTSCNCRQLSPTLE